METLEKPEPVKVQPALVKVGVAPTKPHPAGGTYLFSAWICSSAAEPLSPGGTAWDWTSVSRGLACLRNLLLGMWWFSC